MSTPARLRAKLSLFSFNEVRLISKNVVDLTRHLHGGVFVNLLEDAVRAPVARVVS